jgi:hypothetical protein
MSPYQGFGEIYWAHLQGRSVYREEEVDTYLLNLLNMSFFFIPPQVFPCNVVA